MNKIRHGKISLTDAKSNQKDFKEDLKEINKRNMKKTKNQKGKKTLCTIMKCFTKQKKRLLNILMIIFQWCLKQNFK